MRNTFVARVSKTLSLAVPAIFRAAIPPPLHIHSYRKATIGSTRIARRAGM
jgi:hypothetical protein